MSEVDVIVHRFARTLCLCEYYLPFQNELQKLLGKKKTILPMIEIF